MSYKQQLQRIANSYMKEAGGATAREIASWAIEKGFWEPHRSKVIDICAAELAQAMREEYFKDPQGRRVRAKHVAIITKKGKQLAFWDDMHTASREHMEIAFQNRRQHVVGECGQLKTDVDSYNQNQNTGEPIQIIFDFREDLADSEGLRSNRRRSSAPAQPSSQSPSALRETA